MQVIDLKKKPPQSGTFLIYGGPKSGKSRLAATFPRPRFLADALENGWRTLQSMNPELFYEPSQYPEVRVIESGSEMIQQIDQLKVDVARSPGSVQTLVVDSLSFYGDMYHDRLLRNPPRNKSGEVNGFEIYGNIYTHFRDIATRAHELNAHNGLNIVWIIAEEEDGTLHLPGKKGASFYGLVSNFLVHQVRTEAENGTWQFKTSVIGRDSMPPVLKESTYRSFAEAAGWGEYADLSRPNTTSPNGGKVMGRLPVSRPPVPISRR